MVHLVSKSLYFPVVISNFKVQVNNPFSDKKINPKTEISNMFYLCVYNLKHSLKDSRFILLKLCCLNVRSLHSYSSSEIANIWHKCECFPFPCPWQTLQISCVILSCQTLANPHLCHRVLINIVLEKTTTISSELANVKPNCHYYTNWFGCVSSYVNSLNTQGYQNFGKTYLKFFNVTKIEYIIFPDWFGLYNTFADIPLTLIK